VLFPTEWREGKFSQRKSKIGPKYFSGLRGQGAGLFHPGTHLGKCRGDPGIIAENKGGLMGSLWIGKKCFLSYNFGEQANGNGHMCAKKWRINNNRSSAWAFMGTPCKRPLLQG